MPSTTTPGGRPDFLRRLQEIREDPQVKALAMRRAGDREIAHDALQETYCALASMSNPEQIRDLRAYFCRVLIRQVYRLRGQLQAARTEDFPGLVDVLQDATSDLSRPAEPSDETASRHVLARWWLDHLARHRADLTGKVPGRSPDRDRYRKLIVAVAERLIAAYGAGVASDALSNETLRDEYPEWFAAGECGSGNAQQRFSRARTDVAGLLGSFVRPDDLRP